ncbi:hypothetical protein BSG1_07054 [Bacillus sp. SG-1]|nr:hypothetical protein BSG1_07054 [Bacillus sp. SG-1]
METLYAKEAFYFQVPEFELSL